MAHHRKPKFKPAPEEDWKSKYKDLQARVSILEKNVSELETSLNYFIDKYLSPTADSSEIDKDLH